LVKKRHGFHGFHRLIHGRQRFALLDLQGERWKRAKFSSTVHPVNPGRRPAHESPIESVKSVESVAFLLFLPRLLADPSDSDTFLLYADN
jgi:hypothetical protein